MDDFTSALYLGFRHGTDQIPPWRQLTTGVPAALRERTTDKRLALEVARLQGLEAGILAPSSLHLLWDVMGKLGHGALLLADDRLYQIARWGLERAACRGANVRYFTHHDTQSLQRLLKQHPPNRHAPVFVLTDGWCPHCGKAAPLPAYLHIARKHKGMLLVDDTQAFGIFGQHPTRKKPYGEGGGGLLRWFDVQGPDILTVCSLAKGFGVPLSVLSGSAALLRQLEQQSATRVHCSPVSAAHVHAALHALRENRQQGERLRQKLLQNVRQFKKAVARQGFQTRGSFFPVQTLTHTHGMPPQALYRLLAEGGVRGLLLEPHGAAAPVLSFCLSAAHTPEQIRRAAALLAQARHPSLQKI